tara:strand:- start:197 stop:1189 length:993 start_codon:yes stop_codon:yes gene_type:complete
MSSIAATKKMASREETKKRLREEAKEAKANMESAPMVTHVAKAMKTSVNSLKANETLDEQYHWDKPEDGKVIIAEKRDGSGYVRYVHQEYERKNRVITGEPMLVVDSCMLEDGNLGVERTNRKTGKTWTERNPKKAKYELLLSTGVPDRAPDTLKAKLKESQPKFVASVKTLLTDMIQEAVSSGIWDDALGEMKSKDWVQKGFDNDTHFTTKDGKIELKRNIQSYRGDPQPVRYWKRNKEGRYEQFFPAEIPIGALVIPQYYPKPYCFKDGNDWRYGSTAELGRDLIVVCMPTPRTKEEILKEKEEKEAKRQAERDASTNAALDDCYFEF